MTTTPCPRCGDNLEYIAQYSQWYCPRCQMYQHQLYQQDYKSPKMDSKLQIIIVAIITVIVVVGIAGLLFIITDDNDDKIEVIGNGQDGLEVGSSAPNFVLTDTDNNEFALEDYRGKVVLLDFMATWCGPCKAEFEHLKKVQENYSDDDVVIISIDVDDTETREELVQLMEEYNCTWQFATGGEDVGYSYLVQYIPTLYIIDENGDIAFSSVGLTDYSEISAELDKLV
jgi:thiol-disulfide isomerase/thioredoxin